MTTGLYNYLAGDHDRLDSLLQRATATPGVIEREWFSEFRRGLLRHIGMEERTMLPAIARLQGGRQAEAAARLRLDHGAIAALLVPVPTPAIVATLREILAGHNALEEQHGGVYKILTELAGSDAEQLLETLRGTPEVPVMPYNERPEVLEATRRAVERAGHKWAGSDTDLSEPPDAGPFL